MHRLVSPHLDRLSISMLIGIHNKESFPCFKCVGSVKSGPFGKRHSTKSHERQSQCGHQEQNAVAKSVIVHPLYLKLHVIARRQFTSVADSADETAVCDFSGRERFGMKCHILG